MDTPAETPEEPEDPIYRFPQDYAGVMAHFYRGELGRMMTWRQRFDTTTHWAIIAVTGIIGFAWNHSEAANFLFVFAHVIVYLMMTIEARRYRFYDAYRARVRILESHFIFPVVTLSSKRLEGNWRRMMGADLLMPSFKISFLEALSRRFRRNYVWIYLILLGTWLVYVFVRHQPDSFASFRTAITQDQPLPPNVFLALVGASYLYLFFVFTWGFRRRKASGEFQRRPATRGWTV